MKHKIFAIHDGPAAAFLPPFFLPEQAQATRTFSDCINDPNHAFGRHPKDYTLFLLGDFDIQSGRISPLDAKMAIGNGVEYVVEHQPTTQPELDL